MLMGQRCYTWRHMRWSDARAGGAGDDVEVMMDGGATVWYGQLEAMALVELGADIEAVNEHGMTPLGSASGTRGPLRRC